jgi:hypothetical protein
MESMDSVFDGYRVLYMERSRLHHIPIPLRRLEIVNLAIQIGGIVFVFSTALLVYITDRIYNNIEGVYRTIGKIIDLIDLIKERRSN